MITKQASEKGWQQKKVAHYRTSTIITYLTPKGSRDAFTCFKSAQHLLLRAETSMKMQIINAIIYRGLTAESDKDKALR